MEHINFESCTRPVVWAVRVPYSLRTYFHQPQPRVEKTTRRSAKPRSDCANECRCEDLRPMGQAWPGIYTHFTHSLFLVLPILGEHPILIHSIVRGLSHVVSILKAHSITMLSSAETQIVKVSPSNQERSFDHATWEAHPISDVPMRYRTAMGIQIGSVSILTPQWTPQWPLKNRHCSAYFYIGIIHSINEVTWYLELDITGYNQLVKGHGCMYGS